MIQYSIEPMQERHLHQVSAIERASFGRGDKSKSYEIWSEQSYRDEVAKDNSVCLVAMLADQVIGYCSMYTCVDEGHITKVAVEENYRGQGIAGRLMDRMLEIGAGMGLNYYELEVRRSNDAAIGLYTGRGFQLAGVRKKYYTDNGEDAMIYTRQDGFGAK